VPSIPETDALDLLRHGTLDLEGRLVEASNTTLRAHISLSGVSARCVYKPVRGERPLWDFPDGTLAGRETFVGLQGDWGTLKLGHFLTPYDDLLPIFGNAPTLTTSMLSTAAIWAQGPLSKVQGGFDARLGNSIRYETPPMGGFSGELQYSTRDFALEVDSANNGDHISELRHANVVGIGVFYSKGPIDFGVAYERNNKIRAETFNDDAFSIAGAYDFGFAFPGVGPRVGIVYERLRYDTITSELKRGDLKRDFWGVSATVPAMPTPRAIP